MTSWAERPTRGMLCGGGVLGAQQKAMAVHRVLLQVEFTAVDTSDGGIDLRSLVPSWYHSAIFLSHIRRRLRLTR